MRSHAKASTAGSTMRHAAALGRTVRRAFAIRGASPCAEGSGAPAAARLAIPVVVFAALLAAMALFAIPAGAAKTRLFKETFGSAQQPSFSSPHGIAVDQSSGDVLVMDAGTSTIERYNPDGTPAPFSALGTNTIDGAGTGNCATVPADCDETPQNGLSFASASESEIAVDNSGTATDGDIYVTQSSPKAINVFARTGAYLGQLTGFSEACGVTVDPSGAVYVGDYSSGVKKFVPAANPVVNGDGVSYIASVSNPCVLAAGAGPSAGFLFAATYNGSVSKLDSSSGEAKYSFSSPTTSLAVNPESGDVLQATGSSLKELDATGTSGASEVATVSLSSSAQGVGVNGTSGDVYLDRAGNVNLEVYGSLAVIPDVETKPATGFTASQAVLKGSVNPGGVALTECAFEWGETAAYGQTAACVPTAAGIGSGSSPVTVEGVIGGLKVSTTYHYRLKAANASGSVQGSDLTFTTLGPSIHGVSASAVGTTTATLNGFVKPGGKLTTYHFEYTDDADFQAHGFANAKKKPAPDASAGGGLVDVAASVGLTGLQPGTTYDFRLVAINPDATARGDAVSFTTYTPSPSLGTCPNDGFRTGAGARLPDCRAYEQASPVDKNGNEPAGDLNTVSVSGSGDAVSFDVYGGLSGAVSAPVLQTYVARRGTSNWSTSGFLPPASMAENSRILEWTPDLRYSFSAGRQYPLGTQSNWSLIARDTVADSAAFVHPQPAGNDTQDRFVGASADGSKVYFTDQANTAGALLVPDAALGVKNLYVWDRDTGSINLAGRIPAAPAAQCGAGGPVCEVPTEGANITGFLKHRHAVSADGEQVVFQAGEGQLYARLHAAGPNPSTIEISASQRSTPDPNGAKPATFMWATPSGSTVFFASCEKLTDDSTAASTASPICTEGCSSSCGPASLGQDLYAYATATGKLTDLTVDGEDPLGVQVQGVVGASDDGSYVYFVANADLDGSAGAASVGNCQHGFLNNDYSGECNLYLVHGGSTEFIARLDGRNDAPIWAPISDPGTPGPSFTVKTGRVSADGHTVLFGSRLQQTTYDSSNLNGACGAVATHCQEFYRYDTSEGLTCVTCVPTGAASTGNPALFSITPPGIGPVTFAEIVNDNLSADGNQIFFESPQKLTAADVNGKQDVYEWEAPDSGSCTETSSAYSSQDGGCLYLISTGTGNDPSYLAGAGESGRDVFFFTRDSLVPQDTDQLVDVYDASVDGGLAAQNATPPPNCSGEACRGAGSSASAGAGAGSAVFSGPGNQAQAALRNCGSAASHAQRLARRSKQLLRRASQAQDPKESSRLSHEGAVLAKKAHSLSQGAKRCRQANRRAAR